MLIKSPRPGDPKPSEITDEALFKARRQFLKASSVAAVALTVAVEPAARAEEAPTPAFKDLKSSPLPRRAHPSAT